MAAGIITIDSKIEDADGNTVKVRYWSSDGTVNGVLIPVALLVDEDGDPTSAGGGGGTANGALEVTQVEVRDFMSTMSTDIHAMSIDTSTIPIRIGASEYETVAASQTDQMGGSTGAIGDTLEGLLVIPATTSPGQVSIEDGSTNTIVFQGGASSISDLRPFYIPLMNIASVSGGWEITTGTNVSVIAFGNFT